jgi:hypothetical protein
MFMTIDKSMACRAGLILSEQKKRLGVWKHRAFEVYGNCMYNHKGKSCHPALQHKHNNLNNYIKTS